MWRLSVLPVLLVVAGVGWLGGGVPIPHVQAVQGATRAVEGLGEEPEYIGMMAEWTVQQVVAAEAAAQAAREAARVAQEARDEADALAAREAAQRAVQRPTAPQVTITGDCSAFLGVVSAGIIQRESGGNPNAVNSSSGALGCVQLMPGHFSAQSPWNPNVPGSCYGLDPGTIAGQVACASRLPSSAWNL